MIAVYWFWRISMILTSLVPPRLSYAVAGAMGSGAYYVMPLRRRVARENFAHVLGKPPNDPDVGRVARQSFCNFARYIRDMMLYPSIPTDELETADIPATRSGTPAKDGQLRARQGRTI